MLNWSGVALIKYFRKANDGSPPAHRLCGDDRSGYRGWAAGRAGNRTHNGL
jgi:hypothetical protein